MPEEATPPAAGAAGPQQAPMGVSPATGPTPNKGYEAQVIQRLGGVAKALHDSLPLAGYSSELGKSIIKALEAITKHLPAGPENQQAQQNNLKQMLMRNAQNSQQMQGMKQQMAMPPGGAGGAPPPGGPPMAPRAA